MDEARLAGIEAFFDELHEENLRGTVRPGLFALDRARTDAFLITASMLLGEVRRLRAEVERYRDFAASQYTDGRTSTEHEIIEILSYDDTDGEIIARLELYLGVGDISTFTDAGD